MSPAPPHAGPSDDVVDAILHDVRVLLDKICAVSPFSAADLPDIRAALMAAIYEGPIDEPCGDCEKTAGWMCARHHQRAKQCARWTELLHRMDGGTP